MITCNPVCISVKRHDEILLLPVLLQLMSKISRYVCYRMQVICTVVGRFREEKSAKKSCGDAVELYCTCVVGFVCNCALAAEASSAQFIVGGVAGFLDTCVVVP